MEEKYSNVEHQKPVGKMSKEEIDVFLDKGYTLRLACLKPDGSPLMDVFGSFQELNLNGLSI